jgi:hypothetical protein
VLEGLLDIYSQNYQYWVSQAKELIMNRLFTCAHDSCCRVIERRECHACCKMVALRCAMNVEPARL